MQYYNLTINEGKWGQNTDWDLDTFSLDLILNSKLSFVHFLKPRHLAQNECVWHYYTYILKLHDTEKQKNHYTNWKETKERVKPQIYTVKKPRARRHFVKKLTYFSALSLHINFAKNE